MKQKKPVSGRLLSFLFLIVVVSILFFTLTSCSSPQPAASGTPTSTMAVETAAPTTEAAETTIETTAAPTAETAPAGTDALPAEGSSFSVLFLDVGQADAALLQCDGKTMLIDGGNAEDSNLIYSVLKRQNLTYLDYVVCTHGHEDHVGGLSGALQYAAAGTAFCSVDTYDSKAFQNFTDRLAALQVSLTIPKPGDTFSLGSASVTVLGPITASSDPNDTSLVLRVVYGETSFLFTGDAGRSEEQDLLAAGQTLQSTVLKVGHHGSDTSTTYPFLREVDPDYAVISVGTGNSYGHPNEDTLSRLRDADVITYRTDLQGDILCTSDGKAVTFTAARNQDADTLSDAGTPSGNAPAVTETTAAVTEETTAGAQEPAASDYVLNTSTKKFHYPNCSSVDQIKAGNRKDFSGSRDELLAEGYSPCKRCNP